jgi:hypothetical protein
MAIRAASSFSFGIICHSFARGLHQKTGRQCVANDVANPMVAMLNAPPHPCQNKLNQAACDNHQHTKPDAQSCVQSGRTFGELHSNSVIAHVFVNGDVFPRIGGVAGVDDRDDDDNRTRGNHSHCEKAHEPPKMGNQRLLKCSFAIGSRRRDLGIRLGNGITRCPGKTN